MCDKGRVRSRWDCEVVYRRTIWSCREWLSILQLASRWLGAWFTLCSESHLELETSRPIIDGLRRDLTFRDLNIMVFCFHRYLFYVPLLGRIVFMQVCSLVGSFVLVLCEYLKFRIESNSYFSIRFDSKQAQLFEIILTFTDFLLI